MSDRWIKFDPKCPLPGPSDPVQCAHCDHVYPGFEYLEIIKHCRQHHRAFYRHKWDTELANATYHKGDTELANATHVDPAYAPLAEESTPQSSLKLKLTEMVHNICKATGASFPDRIDILPGHHFTHVGAAGYENGQIGLLVADSFLDHFPEDQAYAILAHEIGHIVSGHVSGDCVAPYQEAAAVDPNFGAAKVSWEYEFQADDFVKKAGMAKPFVKALLRISKECQGAAFDSPDHPGIVRRVRRLI